MSIEKRKYSAWQGDTGFADQFEGIPDPKQDLDQPEPNYWREKSLEILRGLMATGGFETVLSNRQAEIFRLRVCGFSFAEIGKLLRLSVRTVSDHHREGKDRLRVHINNTIRKESE